MHHSNVIWLPALDPWPPRYWHASEVKELILPLPSHSCIHNMRRWLSSCQRTVFFIKRLIKFLLKQAPQCFPKKNCCNSLFTGSHSTSQFAVIPSISIPFPGWSCAYFLHYLLPVMNKLWLLFSAELKPLAWQISWHFLHSIKQCRSDLFLSSINSSPGITWDLNILGY